MNRIELGKLNKLDAVLTAALDLRTIRILSVLTCRVLTGMMTYMGSCVVF